MRILFVSGADVGGAPRSTIELARRLQARGHIVGVSLGSQRPSGRAHNVLSKAAIKLRTAKGWTWPRELVRPFGTRGGPPVEDSGVLIWRRPNAANTLRTLMKSFQPDVIVANSHPREHLRWMLADARKAGIPFALYMREEHSITHLTVSRLEFDLVVANSRHLAQEAEAAGYSCVFVPSIVDLSAAEVTSSREAVTLINPVEENRPEIMRELAILRQDIRVVLQESWPLDAGLRAELTSWTVNLPNLVIRPRTDDPREIYRDARLIVATYPHNRPRVVLEAQHNGIPVVALAQSALTEAVGDGGVLVPREADVGCWVRTIASVWDDAEGYASLCHQAREHSKREEIDPNATTCRFEEAILTVAK